MTFIGIENIMLPDSVTPYSSRWISKLQNFHIHRFSISVFSKKTNSVGLLKANKRRLEEPVDTKGFDDAAYSVGPKSAVHLLRKEPNDL